MGRVSVDLKDYIRNIPDFPKPGVQFKDITPVLLAPEAFALAIDLFEKRYSGEPIDAIVGIDARGFLLAAPLALRLRKPLVPVRKEGKLPGETRAVQYALEYGSSVVEMHTDAISTGHRALIVDDLLATGGTMAAAVRLVVESGGTVGGVAVLVELTELNGRELLKGCETFSLISY